jgi:DNA (cytosine-5)-methyltransferase 1
MRPRILDLFCCQGGAGAGYHRAGFDVLGIDIERQPRYPHKFIRADALEVLEVIALGGDLCGEGFDAIHASPPCQAFTKAQKLQKNEHPDLIGPTRELLDEIGLPYVIENVPGAPLRDPVELCGTMFGLPLYRHRWFEISGFQYTPPLHGQHFLKQVKMGRPPGPDELHQPVGNFSGVERARADMEMPWASQNGLREAVPPAYTESIGVALLHRVVEDLREAA